MIDTNPGIIHIAGRSRPVTEYQHHNYQVLSFTDVIVRSSNIGAIKIGLRVGTERLSRFVSRFGFGRPASPDFPGESPGIVWDADKWTESALASVSMGYQVGVTPLQMVTAISSVANGGEFVEPRVIRAVYRDSRRYVVTPKILRRTISADTAATLTTIMEGVVADAHGTANAARIRVTRLPARPAPPLSFVNGRYSTSDYNASFVGFIPSRKPVVAIIVVTDSPHAGPAPGYRVGAGVQTHRGGHPAVPRCADGPLSRAAGARGSAGCRRPDRAPSASRESGCRRRSAWNTPGPSRHERARGDAEARAHRRDPPHDGGRIRRGTGTGGGLSN
jgi:cell division protein FtsI/penicillin-binding protein 2